MNSLRFAQAFFIAPCVLFANAMFRARKFFVAPGMRGIAMADTTILVVDDEPQNSPACCKPRFRVAAIWTSYWRRTGKKAIEMVMREHPDLILLDVNMPGMSGLEACKQEFDCLSLGPSSWSPSEILNRTRFRPLDSGADDYVCKTLPNGGTPGTHPSGLATVQFGRNRFRKFASPQLSVDLEQRIVDVRGERVHLSPKEFDVLRLSHHSTRENLLRTKKLLQNYLGTGPRRGGRKTFAW